MVHKRIFKFLILVFFIYSKNTFPLKNNVYITFNQLIENSTKFNKITPFPTKNNRISTIACSYKVKQKEIENHANNVYPFIHEKVLTLIKNFLDFKKQCGNSIERKFYLDFNEFTFIDRLLIKRPLMFMTSHDVFLLRNNITGQGGFENIHMLDDEKLFLKMQDYLTYDEMQISALLGVLVPTFFINDGNRYNKAICAKPNTYEEQGIYIGLVGARFEKPGLMEWQHMIITPEQNTIEKGYGLQKYGNFNNNLISLWEEFYQTKFLTFDEAEKDESGRFLRLSHDMLFDTVVYKNRLKMVLEPFLKSANESGINQNKKVYCHVVGLGLGVWQITPIQTKLMLEVYADILSNNNLSKISDINFSWFDKEYQEIQGIKDQQIFKNEINNIKIHFSKRNPADKLNQNDTGKLIVAMYAWDGNSYPGNEYWAGNLTASGDPAAACCSTIAELQNPLINTNVSSKKLKVT